MTASLANLVSYSVQLGVLVAAAFAVTHVVRLRAPLPSLRFWQCILAIGLALPLIQPRMAIDRAIAASPTFTAFVTTSASNDVSTNGVPVAAWLLAIAVIGAVLRLLWLAVGFVRLRAITRRAEPTNAIDRLLLDLSRALAATATIRITDDLTTPATVGVRRPIILVPRRLLSMPPPVLRAAIAHELIHVRRHDWLHTIGEEIWCALLWFHPAARALAARLSLARETVVDEATIMLTRDRRSYAETLLAFAGPQERLPGVTALIGRRQLSQRIALIAEEDTMTVRRLTLSFAAALLVAGTATSAAVTAFPMTRAAAQDAVYLPGDGVSLPVVVEEFKPDYTPEAMQKKIQGSVWMDVVVGATGDVIDVKVARSLDVEYGLDEAAARAAYLWKFKPGTKDGKPVPVQVVIEMRFTLK